MGFLAEKRILITGLLSKHSIAYGIAKACHREGAKLAFTYQTDRFRDRVAKFAAEFDSELVFPCDVAEDAQIEALFADPNRDRIKFYLTSVRMQIGMVNEMKKRVEDKTIERT